MSVFLQGCTASTASYLILCVRFDSILGTVQILKIYKYPNRSSPFELLGQFNSFYFYVILTTTVTNNTMNRVIGKDGSQGAKLQQLILYSLAQDASLPSFPNPSYANLVDNIIEKAVIGNKNLDPDRLRQSVISLEPELENKFQTEVSRMLRCLSSRNWFTSQLRLRYLSFRGPLCDMSQVAILSSPAESQISSTAKLLHKVATAITSLDTVHAIGCDRKGNRFETQQLRDIFATTRVPGHDTDVLKTSPKSSHVVVF